MKGRAGRTGQSQTGECYVIVHERDMKQVNIYLIFSKEFIYFRFISFEKCYLL
jgi:replicative superfamily II helicase